MGYGTAQRLAFAGLIIGSLLCLAGIAAPYWLVGEINASSLAGGFSSWFGISTTLFKYYTGIWWYCAEYLGETKCSTFEDTNDEDTKNWVSRIASVVCVALSLLCALIGLCRMCCSSGGRTIGEGITAFIAGAAGIVTIAIFASSTNDEKSLMNLLKLDYGWAFFIFIAGTALIVIVSFLLCFAAPDNQVGQVISTHGAAGPTVVVANSTHQSQSFGGLQQPNPYLTNAWQQQQQPNYYQQPTQAFSEKPQSKPPGWA